VTVTAPRAGPIRPYITCSGRRPAWRPAPARRLARRDWRYRAAKVGPDTSAGANQTVQLSTPRRVARHPGNAAHGPEHAHELPERLRVGENVRIGSSRPEKAHSDAATLLRIGVDSPVPVISPAIAGPAPKAATMAAQAALANNLRIAYLLMDAAEAHSYSGGRTRSIVGLAPSQLGGKRNREGNGQRSTNGHHAAVTASTQAVDIANPS
jgi:hypothetical protein